MGNQTSASVHPARGRSTDIAALPSDVYARYAAAIARHEEQRPNEPLDPALVERLHLDLDAANRAQSSRASGARTHTASRDMDPSDPNGRDESYAKQGESAGEARRDDRDGGTPTSRAGDDTSVAPSESSRSTRAGLARYRSLRVAYAVPEPRVPSGGDVLRPRDPRRPRGHGPATRAPRNAPVAPAAAAGDRGARARPQGAGEEEPAAHAPAPTGADASAEGSHRGAGQTAAPETVLHAAGGFAHRVFGVTENGCSRRRTHTTGGLYAGLVEEKQDDIRQTYEVESGKVLGAGMTGWVRIVQHRLTGQKFALKTIRLHGMKRSMVTQMQREIELLSNMSHPNIIRLFDVFQDKDHVYLIMEYCRGGDLYDRLRSRPKGRFSERRVATMMAKVMSAIAYMHSESIAHRDIKLENFIFESEGKDAQIKLIDFGLSKKFNPSQRMKLVAGTSYYVAPEVLRGSYTEACDMWSIGVVTFMLLSGKPPFNGRSDEEIMARVRECRYSFKDSVWGTISREARNFVRCLLEPDVNKRWTADMALQHPWLAVCRERRIPRPLAPEVVRKLQRFKHYSPLKRAALMAVAFALPPDTLQELRQAFFEMDHDMNGSIDVHEMARIGLDESVFEAVDMNNNAKIEYVEFLAATMNRDVYMNRERLAEAFSKLAAPTAAGSAITHESLRGVLGTDYNAAVVERMLQDGDASGRGAITYGDYLRLMTRSPRSDSGEAGSGSGDTRGEGVTGAHTHASTSHSDTGPSSASAVEAVEQALVRRLSSKTSTSLKGTETQATPDSGAAAPQQTPPRSDAQARARPAATAGPPSQARQRGDAPPAETATAAAAAETPPGQMEALEDFWYQRLSHAKHQQPAAPSLAARRMQYRPAQLEAGAERAAAADSPHRRHRTQRRGPATTPGPPAAGAGAGSAEEAGPAPHQSSGAGGSALPRRPRRPGYEGGGEGRRGGTAAEAEAVKRNYRAPSASGRGALAAAAGREVLRSGSRRART